MDHKKAIDKRPPPFSVRMPKEMRAALENAAKADDRMATGLTLVIIKRWLVENGWLEPDKTGLKPGQGRSKPCATYSERIAAQ